MTEVGRPLSVVGQPLGQLDIHPCWIGVEGDRKPEAGDLPVRYVEDDARGFHLLYECFESFDLEPDVVYGRAPPRAGCLARNRGPCESGGAFLTGS